MPSSSPSWSSFSAKIKGKLPAKDRIENEEAIRKSGSKPSPAKSGTFSDLRSSLKESNKDDRKKAREEILGKREKKSSAFSKPSPNVNARSSRHDERNKKDKESQSSSSSNQHGSDDQQHEKIRTALERKAKLYDLLQKGKTAGLSDERIQDSLIDWDRKEAQRLVDGSDEEKEEAGGDFSADQDVNRRNSITDDSMVEYQDEFGRTRSIRKSEMPRYVQREQQREQENSIDEKMVTYGPSTSFPVYKPDPSQRIREMANKEGVGSYKRSAVDHFDSRQEKRYRGAGFFQFSQDEQIRQRQMNELRNERETTKIHRSELDQGKDE